MHRRAVRGMPSTVARSKVNDPSAVVRSPLRAVASQRGASKVNRPPKTRSWSAVDTARASRTWPSSREVTSVRPPSMATRNTSAGTDSVTARDAGSGVAVASWKPTGSPGGPPLRPGRNAWVRRDRSERRVGGVGPGQRRHGRRVDQRGRAVALLAAEQGGQRAQVQGPALGGAGPVLVLGDGPAVGEADGGVRSLHVEGEGVRRRLGVTGVEPCRRRRAAGRPARRRTRRPPPAPSAPSACGSSGLARPCLPPGTAHPPMSGPRRIGPGADPIPAPFARGRRSGVLARTIPRATMERCRRGRVHLNGAVRRPEERPGPCCSPP